MGHVFVDIRVYPWDIYILHMCVHVHVRESSDVSDRKERCIMEWLGICVLLDLLGAIGAGKAIGTLASAVDAHAVVRALVCTRALGARIAMPSRSAVASAAVASTAPTAIIRASDRTAIESGKFRGTNTLEVDALALAIAVVWT